MDNQNANGGFSPNPANFPGQFGSYDPNAGQQPITSGQLDATKSAPIDPVTGIVMPQANYGKTALTAADIPMQQEQATPMESPTNTATSPEAAPIPEAPSEKAPIENFIVKPNLVNLQTKSLVESQREMSADELAKANAYAAEVQRQERQAKRQKAAKRIGVYVGLGAFGLIFIGVLVFLIVEILNTSNGGIGTNSNTGGGQASKLNVIDGYQCKTENCKRMNDLPDGRILLRDQGYIIYDKKDATTTLTAIDDQDYNSITSFTWGEKTYAVIDPVSDKSGLFSISDNRMVISYRYDKFYTDINDSNIYGDMAWVTSQYIIAYTSAPSEYHVVDLISGQSILRGSSRVFMHDGFFIGYEGEERRVYTSGADSAFLVVGSNDYLFTRDGILIIYKPQTYQAQYYDASGKLAYNVSLPFWSEINRVYRDALLAEFKGNTKYYKIPGNP